MTKQALELLQKALALPEADRAALAGSLLESLDQVVEADAELAWKNEIARRISDLDSGKAKTVPWEELRSRLSARLNECQINRSDFMRRLLGIWNRFRETRREAGTHRKRKRLPKSWKAFGKL